MSTAVFYPSGSSSTRPSSGANTVDITWQHPGTGNTLTALTLKFTTDKGVYRVTSYIDNSNVLSASGTVGAGEEVSLPITRLWQGTAGTGNRFFFYKVGNYDTTYSDIRLELTYTPNATASTATVAETEAGQAQTVAITNTDSTVQHRVTWDYGSGVSYGPVLYGAATRYPSWAVPAADLATLYQAHTNEAVIEGTVTVETLTADGTSVGSVQADALLRIPASAGPTLTVATAVSHDATAQAVIAQDSSISWVQHHSSLVITPTAAGQYGADISGISIRTPGGTTAAASETASVILLETAGSQTVTVTATDTRGLTRTVEVPLTVTACEAPRITGIDAQRWSAGDGSGHQDDDGRYAQVWAAAQGTALSSGISWTYVLRASGSQTTVDSGSLTLDGNGFGYVGRNLLDPAAAYTLTVTATDSLGQSASAAANIPTGLVTVHILQGGRGLALGKTAEHAGLEISEDWPIRVEGQLLRERILDIAHPRGSILRTVDGAFDPMAEWPWTEWGRLADETVDGITAAVWVRGK